MSFLAHFSSPSFPFFFFSSIKPWLSSLPKHKSRKIHSVFFLHHLSITACLIFSNQNSTQRPVQALPMAEEVKARISVIVKGPRKEKESDHKQQLLCQLEKIPKDTQALHIDEETPSDAEWALLGEHFNNVDDLLLSTGWSEELNDEKLPLHWPLKRLMIDSASGDVVQSPFVLEGKVEHLALLLTSGLRFEGPTNEEFAHLYKESVEKGDIEGQYVTVDEGTPEERKVEIIFFPKIIRKWMDDKYSKPQDPESQPKKLNPEDINLRTLEIIENDAMDAFTRLTLARGRLATSLDTLNIRSTNGCEFDFTHEQMFSQILPQLGRLETLVLTVGEVFYYEDSLPSLYKFFPPNISTLRFRGPASLVKSKQWPEWVKSFENPEYLPNLKTLSVALDLNYEEGPDGIRKKEVGASKNALRQAKKACNQLYAAAKKRGILVEPFHDKWAKRSLHCRQVDKRWEKL